MMRRLEVTADVLEDRAVPLTETTVDAERAIRRALENEGFDVGRVDVRCRELSS